MPYSIQWYIPNEIIFARYWGAVATAELETAMLEAKDLIETSPRHLVHTILDVGDITESAPLGESLQIVRKTGFHARAGWQISIREKSMLVKMGTAFARSILNVRTKNFDTFDEAAAFLRDVDDTLAWQNADPSVLKTTPG